MERGQVIKYHQKGGETEGFLRPPDLRDILILIDFYLQTNTILLTQFKCRVFPSGSRYLWSCDAGAWTETSDQQAGLWG